MNALRNIIDVKDKKIIIDLPEDFQTDKVEVIVLPYADEANNSEKIDGQLSEFFENSPLYDSGIEIDRNKDTGRDITL